ncbi:hypothetical protein [Virgibacillus chiguensis]|uniref:Branched-chain amino acid ABC transporter substrate-binding protein n=1 Tax=Virgibacillus chiguensis TaxID=411959 RepID=A0A1M5VCZ4_9BACI|nr:hypothetical protein [Virgibacillus chiguensis]SHH73095.1 hypothetical protein SAMN05421807_11251 [Virgibacillus chiguensis]
MIKKMQDERLKLRNLKHISMVFFIQTVGILAIIIYDGVTKGIDAALSSPVWFVFCISMVVLSLLNLSISIDTYENIMRRPGPYYRIVLLAVCIGLLFGLAGKFLPGGSISGGLIVGSVGFICFLAVFSYGYYLKKKRYDEHKE